MRTGERHGRGFTSDEHHDELTPQDMILGPADARNYDEDEIGVPTIRRRVVGGGAAGRAPVHHDDEIGVPTVRKPNRGGAETAPAIRQHRSMIPPPSQAGGDESLDFESLLRAPLPPLEAPEQDFDVTPMPTAANSTGSVAPVALHVGGEEDDDWVEQQLRQHVPSRAKWPYALAAVGVLGVGLVAASGWTPSWKQSPSASLQPPAMAALAPVSMPAYRVEDLPVVPTSEDPEEVYREIQAQLEDEARQTAAERKRREALEERERSRGGTDGENVPAAALSPSDEAKPTGADQPTTSPDRTTDSQPDQEALPPFDREAANAALTNAAGAASACRGEGVPGGQVVRVAVTFSPSGRVNSAQLTEGTLLGTSTGSCVARAFRSAAVSPFSGPTVTVHKTVRLD